MLLHLTDRITCDGRVLLRVVGVLSRAEATARRVAAQIRAQGVAAVHRQVCREGRVLWAVYADRSAAMLSWPRLRPGAGRAAHVRARRPDEGQEG